MSRLIARLDIKDTQLVKGIQFEGLRKYGDVKNFVEKYYSLGVHELFMSDVMASLYGRNRLGAMIDYFSKNCRIPITAGGGINDIATSKDLLMKGADKVAINSALFYSPKIIKELSDIYGAQAIVVSIQARKKNDENSWYVMKNAGRSHTDLNLEEWLEILADYSFGEILVTSIDYDGTCEGLDTKLLKKVLKNSKCPVVYSGGISKEQDIKEVFNLGASAACIGAAFHKNLINQNELKSFSLVRKRTSEKNIFKKTFKDINCVILDLDLGNTGSLKYALEEKGCEVKLSSQKDAIVNADIVWIPGVGNFEQGSKKLVNKEILEALKDRYRTKKWIIGICLGMQLLGKCSEESSGSSTGLGFFDCEVKRIKSLKDNDHDIKLPHIGWNSVNYSKSKFNSGDEYYFIHSFAFKNLNQSQFCEFGVTKYQNISFYSYLRVDNILGFQFHPEKSGLSGEILISQILESIKKD